MDITARAEYNGDAMDVRSTKRVCDESLRRRPGSLEAIIGGFKSAVTRHVRDLQREPEMVVWQARYYEHIMRDEDELSRVCDYIALNPARWSQDANHPDNQIP